MKKLVFPFLFWSASIAYAGSPSLSNIQKFQEKEYIPIEGESISLPTNFGSPVFLSKNHVKLLSKHEIYRIDLVYTKFRTDPDFDQEELNSQRIESLNKLVEQIDRDNPEWRLVEQTGADNKKEASKLFHGFKIYYRLPSQSYQESRQFFSQYEQNKLTVKLDPLKENVIEYSSGTKVTIPSNAIVHKNGDLVKGEVEISYVEYRNSGDIALSGIPMTFHSDDGLNYNFTSKGMYEIRGYKNGEELSLQKPITVDFETVSSIENTDFFVLDENSGEWVKIKPLSEENLKNEKDQRLMDIEEEQRHEFELVVNDNFFIEGMIFHTWQKQGMYGPYEIKSIIQGNDMVRVEFNTAAWKEFQQVKTDQKLDTLDWKISNDGTAVDLPFEQSQDFCSLFMTGQIQNWNVMALMGNNGNATLLAEGADKGHTYPSLVKGLNSDSFGVYNCDQIYRIGKPTTISPNYTHDGKKIKNTEVACVLDLSYNGSFSFDPKNITLNKEGKNALLLFTKDERVYMTLPENMNKLDYSDFSMDLPMADVTDKIKSSDDLSKILNLQ